MKMKKCTLQINHLTNFVPESPLLVISLPNNIIACAV